jgi:hypothetical protein
MKNPSALRSEEGELSQNFNFEKAHYLFITILVFGNAIW